MEYLRLWQDYLSESFLFFMVKCFYSCCCLVKLALLKFSSRITPDHFQMDQSKLQKRGWDVWELAGRECVQNQSRGLKCLLYCYSLCVTSVNKNSYVHLNKSFFSVLQSLISHLMWKAKNEANIFFSYKSVKFVKVYKKKHLTRTKGVLRNITILSAP